MVGVDDDHHDDAQDEDDDDYNTLVARYYPKEVHGDSEGKKNMLDGGEESIKRQDVLEKLKAIWLLMLHMCISYFFLRLLFFRFS